MVQKSLTRSDADSLPGKPQFLGASAEGGDHRLGRRISDSLHASGFPLHHVRVIVHEGTVVLRGHVRSWHGKQMAQQLARGISGAHCLRNEIVVQAATRRLPVRN